MSVKVRLRKDTKEPHWQVDVRAILPGQVKAKRFRYTAPPSITSASGARRWGEQVRRAIEAGNPLPMARKGSVAATLEGPAPSSSVTRELTVREAVELYLADARGRGNAPGTLETKRGRLQHFIDEIGDLPVEAVGEAEASQVRAKLREAGFLASTINGCIGLFATMLQRMVELKRRTSPVPKLGRVRDRRVKQAKAYDDATFEALLAAASEAGSSHAAVLLVAGEAGLRVGEIIGLEVRDVDLELGVLHVERSVDPKGNVGPPKNGEVRDVPMTDRMRDALASLAADRRGTEPLFVGASGGRLSRSAVRDRLHAAQRAVGLPLKGPHVLRHSCATSALAGGADPVAVQKLLGHKHLATTVKTYLHDTGDDARRATAALSRTRSATKPSVTDASRAPQARPPAKRLPKKT